VDRLAVFLATGGGVGLVPGAPGTFGSLLALPLLVALARHGWPPAVQIALVGLAVAAAVPVCGRAGRVLGAHDSPLIVLDEVCGMLVAGLLLPTDWWTLALVFAAFRGFDVLKPFPAGAIDRRLMSGVGVVGDDVVAGIYAHLVVRMLS